MHNCIHDNVIENYLNGNLADAKKRARRVGWETLLEALINDYDKSGETAFKIVSFLKGTGSFQAACDAEFADKNK